MATKPFPAIQIVCQIIPFSVNSYAVPGGLRSLPSKQSVHIAVGDWVLIQLYIVVYPWNKCGFWYFWCYKNTWKNNNRKMRYFTSRRFNQSQLYITTISCIIGGGLHSMSLFYRQQLIITAGQKRLDNAYAFNPNGTATMSNEAVIKSLARTRDAITMSNGQRWLLIISNDIFTPHIDSHCTWF